MRIIVKRFNEKIYKHQKIGVYNSRTISTIQSLKSMISEQLKIPKSSFHLEGYIFGIKILLTDSFDLSFFIDESKASTSLFFENHNNQSILNEDPIKDFLPNLINIITKGNYGLFVETIQNFDLDSEDLDKKTNLNGWQLIHYAALYGQEEILSILLKTGCNANAETNDH